MLVCLQTVRIRRYIGGNIVLWRACTPNKPSKESVMAEYSVVPRAIYTQYKQADGEDASEEFAVRGPNAVAHLLKLFANATDDGELMLEVDGGADNGAVFLMRKDGILFMRSRNLDEPDSDHANISVFEFVEVARQALLQKMREISQRVSGTLWFEGLEFELWDEVVDVSHHLHEEEILWLKRFSRAADGWYRHDGRQPVFMSSGDWRQAYTRRQHHT